MDTDSSNAQSAVAPRWWRSPVVLFLALGAALIAATIAQQWSESRTHIANEHSRIAAIGELKAKQIEQWLGSQEDVALSLRAFRALREDVATLGRRRDAAVARSLRAGLEAARVATGAAAIIALDTGGETLATAGERTHVSAWLRARASETLQTGVARLNVLHRDPDAEGSVIHLDYLVTIPSPGQAGGVAGLLLLRQDPKAFLFSTVQSWPDPSPSAESMLLRRDGDGILFLNELRHRQNTAFSFRLPLARDGHPAVQIVEGGGDRVRGPDYRGKDVLAFGRRLQGTDWYLVAKVDTEEVLATMRRELVTSMLLILGFTLLAAVGATMIWRQQAGLAALRQRTLQAERDALDGHLRMLSQHANDIILLLDSTGRILNANERAFEAYGRKAGGLIGMPAANLRAPDTTDGFIRGFERVLAEGSAIYETVHMRKDGRQFPVEVSARRIDVDGGRYVQAIIRDISERKRADAELRESEERFRAMIEQSISGTCIIDKAGRFVYVNPRLAEILGYDSFKALVGHPVLEFVAPDSHALIRDNLRERLAGEPQRARYHFQAIRKDGSRITLGAHGTPGVYRSEQVLITTVQDVTELRRAEEEVQRTVAKLERALHSTIEVVSTIGELRDPYTHGHEHRVGEIASAIAVEMGLGADRVEGIRVAGYLHDVGKIAVPAEILAKPARLTPVEYELVKGHVQQSYEILKGVEFPWPVAEAAWQHHERLDGSGYPRGLKGDQIILEGRILAVADTVEAMASHRPYRPGLGIEKALVEIEAKRGTLFDERAVDACLRLFREKGYQLPA
jgi:PAS domain S-box-containing protein/putative nucleotidyltransferase with HDIG domain